ncbi:DUF397 domain-containing protein [Streptomyces sp. ST2-7A]|uniref:DUF397 domain-containing protein n=1 Tax=Streptomyces sp. ST2-7A TaxID=2907214 RepID=UPI001F40AEE2|nr:DUF397 domain-containing protein [Streptomyces sp. ST2-7A]MCE7078696.1 DUF397 domain-containing protein [Streptomyces sp. ST2-7A]
MEANWQKSSYSEGNGANCIEVTRPGHTVLLRESEEPTIVLGAPPVRLAALLGAIKEGRLGPARRMM